jgi:hypothetical protein
MWSHAIHFITLEYDNTSRGSEPLPVAQPGKTTAMTPSTTTTTTTTAKPRIRVLGTARYLVESSTRPGLGHKVDVLRLKCGCEAGKYGRRCRHLVLAIQYDDWRRRQQAQAATSRTRSTGMAALQEAF